MNRCDDDGSGGSSSGGGGHDCTVGIGDGDGGGGGVGVDAGGCGGLGGSGSALSGEVYHNMTCVALTICISRQSNTFVKAVKEVFCSHIGLINNKSLFFFEQDDF